MSAVDYHDRIVRDRAICGGEPVFRGTRVPLRAVLAGLAQGASAPEILAGFPSLSDEDVRAAIAYAAASVAVDLPLRALPDFA